MRVSIAKFIRKRFRDEMKQNVLNVINKFTDNDLDSLIKMFETQCQKESFQGLKSRRDHSNGPMEIINEQG